MLMIEPRVHLAWRQAASTRSRSTDWRSPPELIRLAASRKERICDSWSTPDLLPLAKGEFKPSRIYERYTASKRGARRFFLRTGGIPADWRALDLSFHVERPN